MRRFITGEVFFGFGRPRKEPYTTKCWEKMEGLLKQSTMYMSGYLALIIGQYLMTLPQHLELHLSEKQAPLQFLADVCTHTCEVYAEKILNIRNMDALGTKRCLNDIVYLSSVVEDLGSTITPALKNLEKSLRAATPSQPTEP